MPRLLGLETCRGLIGGLIALASDVGPLPLELVDGPRACFGTGLGAANPGLGVAPASGMRDLRFDIGVFGSGRAFAGVSDKGGDGGVGASEAESDLGGGVEAVGEDGVIPLASLPGLRARRLSTARGLGLRDRSLSIVSSATRNFSIVISLSTLSSLNSSLNR